MPTLLLLSILLLHVDDFDDVDGILIFKNISFSLFFFVHPWKCYVVPILCVVLLLFIVVLVVGTIAFRFGAQMVKMMMVMQVFSFASLMM